jgi:hypothetical protein
MCFEHEHEYSSVKKGPAPPLREPSTLNLTLPAFNVSGKVNVNLATTTHMMLDFKPQLQPQ